MHRHEPLTLEDRPNGIDVCAHTTAADGDEHHLMCRAVEHEHDLGHLPHSHAERPGLGISQEARAGMRDYTAAAMVVVGLGLLLLCWYAWQTLEVAHRMVTP